MFKGIVNTAVIFAKKYAPELLMVAAIGGTAATGYLAFKGGMNASARIEELVYRDPEEPITKLDMAKVVAKEAVPAASATLVTWAAIVAAGIISIRRGKALKTVTTAYIAAQEFTRTYRGKVAERLGDHQEAEIMGAIGQDLIDDDPPREELIINTGHGNQLFKDEVTKRYFRSDAEFLRKQQNKFNEWLLSGCEEFCSVNEWFGLIDLEPCEVLDDMGWNVEERLNFEIVWCTDPWNEGEPVGVITYDIKPRADYYGFR